MPKSHHPEGWTILKLVDGGKTVYKIFATWRWENDKWRLSSGAEDAKGLSKSGDEYIWSQSSGSIYHLPLNGEKCCTAYQGAVLENIEARCAQEGIEFMTVPMSDLLG